KVLFKRKPFTLLPPPPNLSDNAEVFVMRGTNEVFTDYEKYLKRQALKPQSLDRDDVLIKTQKKFVDAVNGKSGLNYFDALESETKSTSAIETVFPEVLRDPILRKVQFSQISRVDDLVNSVYDEFKRDFFPGEEVFVLLDEGDEQLSGVIREKAKFPMIRGPSGEVQREAFSRYFVRLHHTPNEECLLDDKHIRRDRKVFTKQNVRAAFLKHSLQREAWIGAPWLVKEALAIQYRLPMEIPSHLLQDHRVIANKQQLLQMKPPRKRTKNFSQDEYNRLKHEELSRMQMQQVSHQVQAPTTQTHPKQHPGASPHQLQQMQNHHQPLASRVEPRPPPPPIIKYPIEDLDIPPKRNGVVRPELAFFTDEMTDYIKEGRRILFQDIEFASMGMLLEVWNTLNVQCEVYVLDSFTFDDFVDAMRYHSTFPSCELLEEVHCAVLKLLVDDKGKTMLSKSALPEMVKEVEEEEESEEAHDVSEVSTPLPDAPARSTRSRLSHVDPTVEHPRSPTGPAEKVHRASEMLGDRTWVSRVGARDFDEGGWEVVVVGVLHQLSLSPVFKLRCERILQWLSPMDQEPTRETARVQYATMDVNLRISALQMITILSISTTPIKEFLENCSEDMTDVRKRKIDHQRLKKLATEELHIKDRERKILLPDNMLPDSPKQESVEPVSTNGDTDDVVEVRGANSSDPDDDAPPSGRSLRRGNDRKRKREEEAARAAEEKKKVDAAKQQPKQSKEFKKLLVDIDELKKQILDHESKINECDADLREANVQRTKVLGKDRFCNRYYWFERNGQPFGGLPRSSTSSYGYANGRIWVQGPDEMERKGFIDRSKEEQIAYQRQCGLTVPERRRLEEGETYLQSANEWGYYDDPVLLDNLIGWLDDRGEREKKLRKELCEWRDTIAEYMEAHKKFKDEEAAKKLEADEEHVTRISTRHKAHEDQSAARERCLKWRNTMAMDELGHLHSEQPKPKPKQKAPPRQQKGVAIPINRHGKPVTRQG
ncbi:hypothetical protein LTR37_015909, partial [Vermiconidia calcicola]